MEFLKDWCLKNDRLDLLEEWHKTKNVGLSPETITIGSGKKVWWIKHYDDPKTGKHFVFEWCSTINDKLRYSCPYLSKPARKILPGFNDLFTDFPCLKSEWDYEKNSLNPFEVTSGSGKKVFWKCSNNHSFEMRISHRVKGHGCPYCAGHKVVSGEDDLVTVNPDFLKEWDYEKNEGLDPKDYKSHSIKSVWWKCELGHSWKTTIAHRTEGSRCPHCYKEYGTSFAEQAILYFLKQHFECENRVKLFGKEIDIFIPKLRIGFEYDGIAFHSGVENAVKEADKDAFLEEKGIKLFRIKEADINLYDDNKCIIFCVPDRKYEYLNFVLKILESILGITFKETFNLEKHSSLIYNAYLREIKNNNIVKKFPEIIKEWDYAKNGDLKPEYFLPSSNKKVWWKCSKCGSSYFTDISHKTGGTNCPYCSGKKVNNTNSFSSKYPNLLKFWDYSKNTVNPDNIYYSSGKKVWWICEKCGESYLEAVCQRIKTKTNHCPECFHKHIGIKNQENALRRSGSVFDNELLIIDWDYSKNERSPKDIPQTSSQYVYWKCHKCGFQWRAKVNNRNNGTGCPKCRNEESHLKHCKPVEQYNFEGVLIQTFDSVRHAITITHDQNIPKCLKGTLPSSKGFIYKYKNY